jgi:ElaB/YqjD/DUF883 family membrane-anchored ribosome-binding protein
VANQYLHSHGGRYQKFTQYSRVRSRFDLDSADVRIDRIDSRTEDAKIELDENDGDQIKARQQRIFFQQPSGARREVMGERRASGRLPPPSVPANFFSVECLNKQPTTVSNSRYQEKRMTFEDTANSTVRTAMDQGRQAADMASQAVKDGYDAAQQYVKDKGMDLDLRDFVRREPWLAIAAAFAVGYFAAQIVRRVS